MKKVVVLIAFLSSMAAHAGMKAQYVAHQADFTISAIGAGPGETVYYTCDSVVAATKDILKSIGAKNISVDCNGGLDYPLPASDAFVSANFDSLVPAAGNAPTAIDASFNGVTLSGSDNCYLVSSILSAVSSDFTIASLAGNSCFNANDAYSIRLSVLK